MKVLVIEDDDAIRQSVSQKLRGEGYAVEEAAEGNDGLFQATEMDFDLAVIDLGLPGKSGIEIIQQLRKEGRTTPVLILTARGNWQDKVEGLDAGADDYLVKPFAMEELQARVKALIRRSKGKASNLIHAGPISLDVGSGNVTVNQAVVDLTAYEYRVLQYLMFHPGEIISKTTLTEHLYEQDFDRDSNVIEVFVGRLRKKIDPENSYKPLETIRGRGYRFTLDVSND